MKKTILLAVLLCGSIACKKDVASCWECENENGVYVDHGCGLTQKQIDETVYTDYAGNVLPKPKCRRK